MSEETPFSIPFDSQHIAWAVRSAPDAPPEQALNALPLPLYRGVVVVHGGAGGMGPEYGNVIRHFVLSSLAPFAQENRVLIADGGTRVGMNQLLGDTRRAIGGTYPLVGVCPLARVTFPGGPAPDENRYPLDSGHSHFILVEGDDFGSESDLLVGLLRASGKPGLALIINGGEIVLNEVRAHASQDNPIVTLRGSGRTADELAEPDSAERAKLPPGTRLKITNVNAPEVFVALLKQIMR